MRAQPSRLAATLVLVLLVAACASPPDRVALSSLEAMKATADSGMRMCGSLYAQGRVYDPTSQTWTVVDPSRVVFTDEMKAKAIDAYDKFAAASKTAAFALGAATTPDGADAIIREASNALAQLLELLRAFGVKV
jgi:hypothetical protein